MNSKVSKLTQDRVVKLEFFVWIQDQTTIFKLKITKHNTKVEEREENEKKCVAKIMLESFERKPSMESSTLRRSFFLPTLKQELKLYDEENGGTMESRDKRVSRYILF